MVSETVELLQAGRNLAWLGLVPAFDHAILLAQEAEYVAIQSTRTGELPQAPVYPPLVVSLANSMRGYMIRPYPTEPETVPASDHSSDDAEQTEVSPPAPRKTRATFIPRHAADA